MKFYSFADISAAADCREIASALYGCRVSGGRTAALWRGGDNPESVAISRDEWYDHAQKRGGGALQLAAFKFAGDIQQAQAWLGEFYHLTPKVATVSADSATSGNRYERLIADGYQVVSRYDYTDLDGAVRHFTVRLQHPERPGKEFIQGTPLNGSGQVRWSLRGVETILYRLPDIAASSWVAICEGEKSADLLASLGIPATTAPMGAGKWQDAYTAALAGKAVAILPDNDDPGREHAQIVAAALAGHASTVKIVGPLSARAKGGVDDWLTEEHHTADDLLQAISDAPEYAAVSLAQTSTVDDCGEPTPAMLADAKQANSTPFRNYLPQETEVIKRGKPTKEIVKEPRNHQAMLDDLARRFLGFPRKIGDWTLFDYDRDTGCVIEMESPTSLMAWIARRSKRNPEFARGDGMAKESEFYESVRVTCHKYESYSLVPDYPRRSDVYYAHGPMPAACPDRSRFWKFVDFFLPATDEDRLLIASLACTPLWYMPGIDRPSWIIDSRDGQGSGKTNLAELISELYGHAPISTSPHELQNRMDVLLKRCLSSSGRKARVMLVDNVTGDFQSPELAELITRKDITGMAPYGHGEEVRPNNLVYVITANSATVSTDIADRSYYIHLCRPAVDSDSRAGWKGRVQSYIAQHRLEIIADIIAIISGHKPFASAPRTRFAAYEVAVLQAVCGSEETYMDVIETIKGAREESNVEQDQARAIAEVFAFNIERELRSEIAQPVFIRTELANSWGRQALRESVDFKGYPIQLIRNLAKSGFLPQIDGNIKRWPMTSRRDVRWSGIAWNFSDSTEQATVLGRDADGNVTKVVA